MRRIPNLLLAVLLSVFVAVSTGSGLANEAYPSRLVKVIVAFPPGSTLDALTRIVAERLAKKWGQSVLVENISGGGGNIGTERFARSDPDGYTLLLSPPGPLTVNPMLYGDASPDPAKFTPVSLVATTPNVLLVKNALGVGTVQELLAKAQAQPGKITYASQGVGSTPFLTMKLLESRTGVQLTHVPYRGSAPALTDIVAGHVDGMFDTIGTSAPLHRAGTARILAVASAQRFAAMPEIPTMAEAGVTDFRSGSFFGMMAPPNTPQAIADKISGDVHEIMRQPEVSAKLREIMLEAVGSTPADTSKFLTSETALWSQVIKATGASLR
jgi:tripartite-type tricarboxylate transporter receptor subunit TctC